MCEVLRLPPVPCLPSNQVTLPLVSVQSGPLQFDWPVYPTRLTIQLITLDGDITWLEENISRLPFHHRLHELTIKIICRGQGLSSFPKSACYETLCRLLLPHQYPALLKRVIFNVILGHPDIDTAESDSVRMRETVRLKSAFSPLSAAGAFSAQVVLAHHGLGVPHPIAIMQCTV